MNLWGAVVQFVGGVITLVGLGLVFNHVTGSISTKVIEPTVKLWYRLRAWFGFRGKDAVIHVSAAAMSFSSAGNGVVTTTMQCPDTLEEAWAAMEQRLIDMRIEVARDIEDVRTAAAKRADDVKSGVEEQIGTKITEFDQGQRRRLLGEVYVALGGLVISIVGMLLSMFAAM